MAILKKRDVAEKDILDDYIKKVKIATKETKKLQDQVRAVQKAGTGSEAKERVILTNKLTKATLKLRDTLTAEDAVKKQILRANAKLHESRTKAAKDLALVRQKTLQANKALRDQAKASLGVKKSFAGLGKQLLGAAGLIGGFTALIGILKNAFKIFVNFQKTNSKLASVLGKTRKEIKSLSEQQKELGSTTAFTASQVGELQIELAKLGFSLREIEASTPGILALAAATGAELAQSAELAGATLRIFNLDASEMSRVTDVLALATSKSSLSMEKLATILPTVGKTAQIAGVSLEKTAALAGTLTDRGLDASSAATSLRNIFLELSKQGLTWNEAMQQINESTNKNKTSMDLFGKRAAAAGVILSETAESTDELTTALNNADGAAQKMADTMLDNLAGDITIAQSAWEGFILSIEDGEGIISKAMRSLIQDFTDFLGTLILFNETTIINKLKLIANAALSLFETAFLPLVKVLRVLGIEMPRFRFEIEKTSESTNELTAEQKKAKEEAKALAAEQKRLKKEAEALSRANARLIDDNGNLVDGNGKVIKSSQQLAREYKERIKLQDKLIKRQIKSIDLADKEVAKLDTSDIDDRLAAEMEAIDKLQAREDEHTDAIDTNRAHELDKIQDFEDAKLLIIEHAINSGQQLASDIFSAFQDEKLARINSNAEAEKKILQQRLDDGVISEEQFASQVAAIEKKQRIESAKAEKKKAIFDIVIAGIVAAIKALPNFIASAAILVAAGISAAVVAAKPIPKFAEGTEFIEGKGTGKSDSNIVAVSTGERIVPADINEALHGIPNADLPRLVNQDANMLVAGLLMQNNKNGNDIVTLLGRLGLVYTRDGQQIIERAGSGIERNLG